MRFMARYELLFKRGLRCRCLNQVNVQLGDLSLERIIHNSSLSAKLLSFGMQFADLGFSSLQSKFLAA
jgi:hypothetical protein